MRLATSIMVRKERAWRSKVVGGYIARGQGVAEPPPGVVVPREGRRFHSGTQKLRNKVTNLGNSLDFSLRATQNCLREAESVVAEVRSSSYAGLRKPTASHSPAKIPRISPPIRVCSTWNLDFCSSGTEIVKMPIDLEAIRARVEERRKDGAFRTFGEVEATWCKGLFADFDALIAEVLDLNSVIGDYIKSTQSQAEQIAGLTEDCAGFLKIAAEMRLRAHVAEAKLEWIPVTERLPESNCSYLTSNGVGVFEANFVNGAWYSLDERHPFITDITHWMPMLEPPK